MKAPSTSRSHERVDGRPIEEFDPAGLRTAATESRLRRSMGFAEPLHVPPEWIDRVYPVAASMTLLIALTGALVPFPEQVLGPALLIDESQQTIVSPVDGVIDRIWFGSADSVSLGDTLITLRIPELEERSREARSAYDELVSQWLVEPTDPAAASMVASAARALTSAEGAAQTGEITADQPLRIGALLCRRGEWVRRGDALLSGRLGGSGAEIRAALPGRFRTRLMDVQHMRILLDTRPRIMLDTPVTSWSQSIASWDETKSFLALEPERTAEDVHSCVLLVGHVGPGTRFLQGSASALASGMRGRAAVVVGWSPLLQRLTRREQ